MKKELIFFVFVLVLISFASAAHPDYPAFAQASFTINNNVLSISDDIIYNTGYYSVNGGAWQQFTLQGTPYGDGHPFLVGSGTGSLNLPSTGTHYVILFSCSLVNNAWDCHENKWQLEVIRNSNNNPDSSCGINGCEYGEDCYTCPEDCGSCPTPSGTHYLVRNGNAVADIVYDPDAAPVVDVAARELQNGIRKMTGVTLPIRTSPSSSYDFHVYVGRSDYTDDLGITASGCRDGGYKMVSGNDYLVLLGDDREYIVKGPHGGDSGGSMSDWYDACDCDLDNKYVSTLHKLYYDDWDLWEADQAGSFNAVNAFLEDQGMRWFYLGDIGEVVPSKDSISFDGVYKTVNPDFAIRNMYLYFMRYGTGNEEKILYRLRLGLNGVQFYRAYPGGHGLEPIAEAYPQYTINGDPDLCSEEFYDLTLEYIKKIIEIYDEHEISAMPTDGFSDSYRQVSGCVTDTETDYTWEFINNIAWDIYEEYGADRRIVSTVYYPYNKVPKHLTRSIAPNLRATFIYNRAELVYEGYKNEERNYRMENWLEILPPSQAYTSSYYLSNRCDLSSRNVPLIYPRMIDQDLKYVYGKGMDGGGSAETLTSGTSKYLSHGCDVLAGNNLNIYVHSKLHWDVHQDVDDILDDYYEKFYGPASEEMKEFHEYVYANYHRADGFPEAAYPHSSGDPSVNRRMRSLLSEARAAAGSGIYRDRVDLLIGLMEDCTSNCGGQANIDGG